MACRTEDCKSSVPADPYIVRRVSYSYQIAHLNFLAGDASLPVHPRHPHFDHRACPTPGLPGRTGTFFYALYLLFYTFRKPGEVQEKVPGLLQHWDMDNLLALALSKQGFVLRFTQTQMMSAYWGEACETLLEEVQAVFRDVTYRKSEIRASRDLDEAKLEPYGAMARDYNIYYEKVKSAFDKAIGDLEKEGPNADEIKQDPVGSRSPLTPSRPLPH